MNFDFIFLTLMTIIVLMTRPVEAVEIKAPANLTHVQVQSVVPHSPF